MNRHTAIAAVITLVFAAVAQASTKHISKQDFGESWPFTVDSGTLACTSGGIVTFTANGNRYAVNGTASAAGHPDIEPIWAMNWTMIEEMAEALDITPDEAVEQLGPIRISISPIIKAGLKLC